MKFSDVISFCWARGANKLFATQKEMSKWMCVQPPGAFEIWHDEPRKGSRGKMIGVLFSWRVDDIPSQPLDPGIIMQQGELGYIPFVCVRQDRRGIKNARVIISKMYRKMLVRGIIINKHKRMQVLLRRKWR